MSCVPEQGSHVFVFFENGDFMSPRYFAISPISPKLMAETQQALQQQKELQDVLERAEEDAELSSEAMQMEP